MFHDLIVFVALGLAAGFVAMLCFSLSRPERFPTKLEWWKAEGCVIFGLAWILLLIVAVSRHTFHLLR